MSIALFPTLFELSADPLSTGPSNLDSGVCRSCQGTLGRRNYASAATETATAAEATTDASAFATTTSTPPFPYTINAGVVLSRPPQVTRDLEPFEKAYHFYQKRLNERLALPFTKYFYFKRGTPADEDWKKKIQERRTPARDIGKYNAYASDSWNDELLLGSKEAEPDHQVEMLVQDAESTANATSQDTSKKEEIPRPHSRVTEADKKGDHKSLNRMLSRTLYLLVQSKEGYWKFPSTPVETDETLRQVSTTSSSAQFSNKNQKLQNKREQTFTNTLIYIGCRAYPFPDCRCQHEHLDGWFPPRRPPRLHEPQAPR